MYITIQSNRTDLAEISGCAKRFHLSQTSCIVVMFDISRLLWNRLDISGPTEASLTGWHCIPDDCLLH